MNRHLNAVSALSTAIGIVLAAQAGPVPAADKAMDMSKAPQIAVESHPAFWTRSARATRSACTGSGCRSAAPMVSTRGIFDASPI
jgi:hypothetical protein